MTTHTDQDLREAARLALTLEPEDEKELERLDTARQWLVQTPAPTAPGAYVLILGREGEEPFWLPLRSPQLVIGREPGSAGLVLKSTQVSRRHCVLEAEGDDWRVRDLGSTNGVHVNGKRQTLAWLASGDLVQVGSFRLFFLVVRATET